MADGIVPLKDSAKHFINTHLTLHGTPIIHRQQLKQHTFLASSDPQKMLGAICALQKPKMGLGPFCVF